MLRLVGVLTLLLLLTGYITVDKAGINRVVDSIRSGQIMTHATTSKPYYPEGNKDLSDAVSVIEQMRALGINQSEIVYAQSILETAHFTSDIFLQNKNPFGMKHSDRGFSVGINLGHAKYEDVQDALYDYKYWQKRWKMDKIVGREEYLYRLDHLASKGDGTYYRYATDPDYTTKVEKILNTEVLPKLLLAPTPTLTPTLTTK